MPAAPAPVSAPGGMPAPSCPEVKVLPIDLPTALRLANASNPTIALARERTQEAYARLRQAEVMWLPDLQGGPAYNRHDGRIQNSRGMVFSTNKQNFFIGGGAVLALDTSEALFGPLVARRLVQAQEAAARAVTDNVQLDVALAYLDLLRVYGALAVNAETLAKAEEMLRRAAAAENTGFGKTPADANRARTEVEQRRVERIDLEGQAAAVSARLAQLLLLEPTVDLWPREPAVVPIALVPDDVPLDELVATGLMNRPELAEGRALIAAALARWRQARVGPLIPRLEATYTAGEFGGGINDDFGSFGGRGDGLAQALWTFHNFGAGDVARARVQRSLYGQANLHLVEVEAQVAAEVTAAAKQVRFRLRTLASAQRGVREAEEMWRRLEAQAFGVGGPARRFDPLEPLLAEQALHEARVRYLDEVIGYNREQFRLYTALGQPPIDALPKATALPVEVPTLPGGTLDAPPVLPPPAAAPAHPDLSAGHAR
jgi:outer membrane protein TolC